MSGRDLMADGIDAAEQALAGAELLRPLVDATASSTREAPPAGGVVIGQLVGIHGQAHTPLVVFPGQRGEAALAARTAVDLHGPHIGSNVVLMFEDGDLGRPIVMGVLREANGWPLAEHPGQVEVEADGERMVISASEQLVLRCGKASITLTKVGKVLIEGSYLLSRSSGANRIKGGSIQLN